MHLADVDYSPQRPPFTEQHLLDVDLSPVFVEYMKRWKNFVIDGNWVEAFLNPRCNRNYVSPDSLEPVIFSSRAFWRKRGKSRLWLAELSPFPNHFYQTYSIQHPCSIACTSISACTFVILYSLNGFGELNSTKVIGFGFVDAHGPLTLYYVSTRVDVPSNQQRCLESVLLMRTGHSRCIMFQQEWTCRDLNSGPLPCQGSDLPTDLHAPIRVLSQTVHLHAHHKHCQLVLRLMNLSLIKKINIETSAKLSFK